MHIYFFTWNYLRGATTRTYFSPKYLLSGVTPRIIKDWSAIFKMEEERQRSKGDDKETEAVEAANEITDEVVEELTDRDLDIPQQDKLSDIAAVALEGLMELST